MKQAQCGKMKNEWDSQRSRDSSCRSYLELCAPHALGWLRRPTACTASEHVPAFVNTRDGIAAAHPNCYCILSPRKPYRNPHGYPQSIKSQFLVSVGYG